MRPPFRLSAAAWAHPPTAVLRSTRARAGPEGTRSQPPGLPALARGEDGRVVALDQGADLVAVQHLVLEERLGHSHQGVAVLFHDLLRAVVGAQADRLDLLVDQNGRRLAVVLMLGDLAPQENLLLFLPEGER